MVIDSSGEIILPDNSVPNKAEVCHIPVSDGWAIRRWVHTEPRQDSCIYVCRRVRWEGGTRSGSRQRQGCGAERAENHNRTLSVCPDPARGQGRHNVQPTDSLGLAYPLVIAEEEGSVLFDRPTRRGAELVAA